MIRVAQMTLSMGQGGIENLILSMARHQDRTVFEPSLYCLDDGGELLAFVAQMGVPLRVFARKPGLDLALIWPLAKSLRADRIDVLHTHNQAAHFYGCLAARLAGVPVVINTEHSRHNTDGIWRRRLEKRALSWLSHRYVAVSEELRAASVEKDGIAPGKMAVIVNGVDSEKFSSVPAEMRQVLRSSLGIVGDAKVISIIARLHPIKNHALLLDAFRCVRKESPEAHLLIIGDGELRQPLESSAARLGLGSSVHFLGNRFDVPALMMASDLLTLCSLSEGLPLVLLEAMAAGVPIVVTEGANRAGLIRDGENGMVCKVGAETLAQTILLALGNPEMSRARAEKARTEVSRKFSILQTVRHYEDMYRGLLGVERPNLEMQRG